MIEVDMRRQHECPAPACKRKVPYGYLFCSMHWRKLPVDTRRSIYREWNLGRPNSGYKDAVHEALVALGDEHVQ